MKQILLVSLAVVIAVTASAIAKDKKAHAPQTQPLQLGFLFVHHFGEDLSELEKRATWISEHDLAVALHLVREAPIEVDIDQIVRWRREGSSWDAITRRCQLGCETYFVELPEDMALPEPYARPYETWFDKPGGDQRLTDEEIRELVLVNALSHHCGTSAEEIVRLRSAGQSAKAIAAVHSPEKDVERATATPPKIGPKTQ